MKHRTNGYAYHVMYAEQLSVTRTVGLVAVSVVVLYSLTPFTTLNIDSAFGERVLRFASLHPRSVGSLADLGLHAAVFMALGLITTPWFGGDDKGSNRARACAFLVGLALFIEVYQLFLPTRHAHVADFAAHLIGLACGIRLQRYERVRRFLQTRGGASRSVVWAMLFVSVLAWLCILVLPVKWVSRLDDWDREYTLFIGNEQGGQRPWLGTVRYLALYDYAIPPGDTARRYMEGVPSRPASKRDRAMLEYDFRQGIHGSSRGMAPPLEPELDSTRNETLGDQGLAMQPQRVLHSASPPDAAVQRIAAAGAFSVEVWCRPANLTQDGPARIVGISAGKHARNFTLGQVRADLELRVRNRIAGRNGADPPFRIQQALQTTNRPYHIVATYRQGLSKLYINGVRQSQHLDVCQSSVIVGLGTTAVARMGTAFLFMLPLVASSRVLLQGLQPSWRIMAVGLLVSTIVGCGAVARWGVREDWPSLTEMGEIALSLAIVYPLVARTCLVRSYP